MRERSSGNRSAGPGHNGPVRTALLHIGTAKTGTTSVQATLAGADDDGVLTGIAYPRTIDDSQNLLAAVFRSSEHQPRVYRAARAQRPRRHEADVVAFEAAFDAAITGPDPVVCSAEYLAGFHADEAAALADRLRSAGIERVRALAYVRGPADQYLRMVQQQIRLGGDFGPPRTFRYTSVRALDTWAKVADEIVVRPFRADELVDGDVVADVVHQIDDAFGTDLSARAVRRIVANEGTSAEAMLVLQRYRRRFHADRPDVPTPDTHALYELLVQRTPTGHPRPELLPSLAAALQEQHADDLHRLADRYGVDLWDHDLDGVTPAWPTNGSLDALLTTIDRDLALELAIECLGARVGPAPLRPPPSALRRQLSRAKDVTVGALGRLRSR